MKTINFVIILCLINSCKGNFNNSKNNSAMGKYDFELMKEFTSRGVLDTVIKRGDTNGSNPVFYKQYKLTGSLLEFITLYHKNEHWLDDMIEQ